MKCIVSLAALGLFATACAPQRGAPVPSVAPQPVAAATNANQQLDQLAEAYFEEALALNPTYATSIGDDRYNHLYTASFSEEIRNKSRALDEKYAASLQTINRQALDEEHQHHDESDSGADSRDRPRGGGADSPRNGKGEGAGGIPR